MKKTTTMKKSIRLVSATLATSGFLVASLAATANVAENPFAAEKLPSGYMVADSHGDSKGDGRPCDGDKDKKGEGSCGEGSCGGGEGSSGSEDKRGEGSCG